MADSRVEESVNSIDRMIRARIGHAVLADLDGLLHFGAACVLQDADAMGAE